MRLESSNCINEYEKVIFVTLRLSGHRVSLLNQPAKTAGINYACMDTTARPGDDFAKYATGHWADLNPQPLEYPMWGTVTKVSDENVKALAGLIKDIADHGSLNVAYDAFQMWQKDHGKLQEDNGFTPEQRFFLSYANVWAGTASEEIMRYLTMMDVHSIDRLRINGALAQCDYWYDAFGIQPTDSLYVKPEDRVRIW